MDFPKPKKRLLSIYHGVPIEQMSREELIDALEILDQRREKESKEHIRQLQMLGSLRRRSLWERLIHAG